MFVVKNWTNKNTLAKIKLTIKLPKVSWSPKIGIALNGVGITNSPKVISGMFAAVVKNSTLGSWCILNLNCVGLE